MDNSAEDPCAVILDGDQLALLIGRLDAMTEDTTAIAGAVGAGVPMDSTQYDGLIAALESEGSPSEAGEVTVTTDQFAAMLAALGLLVLLSAARLVTAWGQGGN